MTKIILTSDRYYFDDQKYTFFIYDLDSRSIAYKKEKIEELVCLDLEDRGRGNFRPFGISQNEENIYLASHSKIGVFSKKDFEYLGNVKNSKSFINTHQILKTEDRLYICNTSCDSLGILENSAMRYLNLRDFSFSDDAESPPDVWAWNKLHVNSISEHSGNIYLLFHNLKTEKSKIVSMDRNKFIVTNTIEVGMESHNVVIIGDCLYILSTGTGELIEVDLQTHNYESYFLANPKENFLRGMINLDGNLLIAYSRHLKTSSIRGFSFIKLFDVENKVITDNYLVNKIDVICDIQLLVA